MTVDWNNCPSNTGFLERETDPEKTELTEAEDATDQLRNALEQAYTKDKLSKQVQFNAVCLKKLKEETADTGVVRVKARIPELHSLLPKPRSETDYATMSMYPTFIALQNSFKDGIGPSSDAIPPGSILLTTFGNVSNFSQPRVLEIGNIAGSNARTSSGGGGGGTGTGRGGAGFPYGRVDVAAADVTKVPASEKSGIKKFGAWSYSKIFRSKSHRDKMLKRAKDMKLDFVSIMVNGKSDKAFKIKATQTQMNETVKAFNDIGIEVGICTWIQPTDAFIDGIINTLTPMAVKAGATTLDVDVEEPWTRSGVTKAVFQEKDLKFANLWNTMPLKGSIRLSVNAIVSAPIDIMIRMMTVADEITPQMYATNRYTTYVSSTTTNPYQTLISATKRNWKSVLGASGQKFVVGLAGYEQKNIGALTEADAVDASLMMAKKMGAKEVRYWELSLLTSKVRKAIKVWRK